MVGVKRELRKSLESGVKQAKMERKEKKSCLREEGSGKIYGQKSQTDSP